MPHRHSSEDFPTEKTSIVFKAYKPARLNSPTVPRSELTIALRRRLEKLGVARANNACGSVITLRSLRRWEAGQVPFPRHVPAVIEYLGHDPWPEPVDLAQRLRQARLRQGLTMAQAAARLGVSEGTVWWWEAGRKPRRRDIKLRLDAFIRVPIGDDEARGPGDPPDNRAEMFDLGAAILNRRHQLSLTQESLAALLGVNTWTVLGWEQGGRAPMDRYYPALIRFLGFDPWPTPRTLGERLRAERLRRGLSQEQAATVMQVNPGSVSGWEGGRQPRHLLSLAKIDAFLSGGVRPWRCGRSPVRTQAATISGSSTVKPSPFLTHSGRSEVPLLGPGLMRRDGQEWSASDY